MAHSTVTADTLQQHAEGAIRHASPWITWLGRFGYAAKGVVYLMIGMLATQAGLGTGGAPTDTYGALEQIVNAPFGHVLLAGMVIGLAGYALWRFVQAALDTEDKGSDAKGWLGRATYAGVGVAYFGLALSAVQLLMGNGSGSGSDSQTRDWTARLMEQPFGPVLVAAVGVGVIANGLFHLWRAYSKSFLDDLRMGQMDPEERTLAERAGRLGYGARGIVFGLIGLFLLGAALHLQPDEARGIAGALAALAEQPFGPWLLGAVGIGLAAYGLFSILEARYRRMVLR